MPAFISSSANTPCQNPPYCPLLFSPRILNNTDRIRKTSVATAALNPGIPLLSPSGAGVGVSACEAAGEGVKVAVATVGERVDAGADTDAGICVGVGVCVGFGVDVEVANFSFHAFIPPSIL